MANNLIKRRPEDESGAISPRRAYGALDPFRGFDPFRTMTDLLGWEPLRNLRTFAPSPAFDADFEVRETNTSYVFTADLPGVKESDLEISLTQNMLTVSGRREAENLHE